jgi:hypothetical protein
MPSKRNVIVGMLARNEQALTALMDRASEHFNRVSQGTSLENNYQAQDAFRHVFGSAVLTRDLTEVSSPLAAEKMSEFMGWLHEAMAAGTRENQIPEKNAREIGMDMHNNEVGRAIARELGPKASDEALANRAMQALQTGEAIRDPKDNRALERFESEMSLRGIATARELLDKGVESAKDLLNNPTEKLQDLGTQLWEGTQEKMQDVMKNFKNLPVFKVSDAQVEQTGVDGSVNIPEDVLSSIESQVVAADRWQSTEADYARDSGVLARESGELQRIAQAQEAESAAEASAELEASMDA